MHVSHVMCVDHHEEYEIFLYTCGCYRFSVVVDEDVIRSWAVELNTD